MRQASRQRGFVLLMVLLVLVVCGTVMAAVARRCGQGALRAGAARREVQLRWGALSCRDVVLPKAEQLLHDRQTPEKPIVAETRLALTLGGMTFNMVLGDESAKANVNLLAQREGDTVLAGVLRDLQSTERQPLPVELRPAEAAATADNKLPRRYASYDQVLRFDRPSELVSPDEGASAVIRRRITFWTDGPVNLGRAELPVLREVLAGQLGETDLVRIDELRRKGEAFSLAKVFSDLQLGKDQIEALQPLVTDKSTCHSLWIIVDGKTRSWYRLDVERPGAATDAADRWVFIW